MRVARALGTLPALAEALARGELSCAKVRALIRVATPETEARLWRSGVPVRRRTSSASCEAGAAWTGGAEAREAARRHAGRALRVYRDDDGTGCFADG